MLCCRTASDHELHGLWRITTQPHHSRLADLGINCAVDPGH